MRHILFIIAILTFNVTFSQIYNPVNQYIYKGKLGAGRSTPVDQSAYMMIGPNAGANAGYVPPRVADTAAISGVKRNGLTIFSNQLNKPVWWDSVGGRWTEMGSGSGDSDALVVLQNGSTVIGSPLIRQNALGDSAWIRTPLAGNGIVIENVGDSIYKFNWDSAYTYVFTKDITVFGRTIGRGAGSGTFNHVFGASALLSNSSGTDITAIGNESLRLNTTGSFNVGVGGQTLRENVTGSGSTAVGYNTLRYVSRGFRNTSIGFTAGNFITGGVITTDSMRYSVFVGAYTKALRDSGSNEIVIGYDATGNGSNTTTIGNSSITDTYLAGKLHIGTIDSANTPQNILYADQQGIVKKSAAILSGSATLDFGSTAANSESDLTITVTGAADGDVVSIGVPNGSATTGIFTAWISAADTVKIRFHNGTAGAIDPASGTFKVKIFK